jgi:hypothetical protein
MAHELLGHLWGEMFGGNTAGTTANKRDALDAENVVRGTARSRGAKITHHGQTIYTPQDIAIIKSRQ